MLVHLIVLVIVFTPIAFLALHGLEDCSGGLS